MRHTYGTLLFIFLFWITENHIVAQPAIQQNSSLSVSSQNVEQGVLLVKFKESSIKNLKSDKMSFGLFGTKELDEVNAKIKAKKIKRVFRHAGKFEEAHQKFGLHLWYEVRFDNTIEVATAIEE